jgi:FtsP/CotA-like multicopper oxidase with cupredoxin domain
MIDNGPTRRQFAAGLGATCAVLAAPAAADAQTVPKPPSLEMAEGYRLLRPKFAKLPLRGPGQPGTVVQCFDGSAPGPLIRIRQGDELKARLINGLPDPTSIHWHGVRLPATIDNAAPVKPGNSFDYRFAPPDAGTFWYHAPFNPNDVTARGLYGTLIVDERTPPDIDRDVLLVFDNWRLDSNGVLGREGEHLTTNGAPAFDIAVKTNERLRVRLVNAAPHRVMGLRFNRHQPTVMAIDGQPAQPFIANSGDVVLGPGSRVDIFIDMTLKPGETATLAHTDGTVLARFNYEAGASARPAPRDDAAALPANPLPEKMDLAGALRADFRFPLASMQDPQKSLFTAVRGRTVVLAFDNGTANLHSIHLHGHHFRLLDRLDDGWKPFWLDTLVLPPRQVWRIAFVADNPGKWAIDSRMIGGPETAVTTWFDVL